jgi:DNA-binding beta-propeller fold protein YncE
VNSRVAMFDRSGKWIGEWGKKGAGPGEFNNPHGITFVPGSADLFVADRENSRLQLFDRTGMFKKQWTGVKDARTTGRAFSVATDSAGFYYVGIDIAMGRDGSIYVAETRTKRVVKFRPRPGTRRRE